MTRRTDKLLLAVLAVVLIGLPQVVRNPYHINVINIMGLNAIMVVGLNLLVGYAGQISLGHAAFFGLGAYGSGLLTTHAGLPPWPAMFLAMLITGTAAWLIGIPTLRLSGNYLVMATLGFNLIVYIVINQWDTLTGGPSGLPGIPPLSVGGTAMVTDGQCYYLIWGAAFLAVLLAVNLVHSRAGRALRAIHGSEIAAGAMGVPTSRYKVQVFVLSACLASVSGSLYAHYLSIISPQTFNIFFSVELVTMVMVGGMGSVWGSLFGAVFLTPLPHMLHVLAEYKEIFYGLILVLILVLIPEGLLPKAVALIKRRRPAPKAG